MGRHLSKGPTEMLVYFWIVFWDVIIVGTLRLRDFVFVRFYVLYLGLTLRFQLPKLLTLVVSFSLWQPTPSIPLPLLLHQVDTSFTPLLLLLLTLLVFLLCKKQTFTGRYLPFKIWGRKHHNIRYVYQVWHLTALAREKVPGIARSKELTVSLGKSVRLQNMLSEKGKL